MIAELNPQRNELANLDHHGFDRLVEAYHRQLRVHCYRMLGSLQDAEDAVQDALLRAWESRDTFEGRASVRNWLYKIATNVCLDRLRQRTRRGIPITLRAESTLDEPIPPGIEEPIWLEPYPDDWLPDTGKDPEHATLEREHISLAFIAALHVLPPRQRAVLILRDVLGLHAEEVATQLDMSVAAAKSALHRARATLAERQQGSDELPVSGYALDAELKSKLDQYVTAWRNADVEALVSLLATDATFSMPPIPSWYRGREVVGGLVAKTIFRGQAQGRWLLRPTHANGQIAFGLYARVGDTPIYAGYGIQVVTMRGNMITDITTFRTPTLFQRFPLPDRIEAP